MSGPKRVSLRDRDQAAIEAIGAPVAAAPSVQTAADEDEARPWSDVPLFDVAANAATSAPAQTVGERGLGTYWKLTTFDRARSAYVGDLDTVPEPVTGFARWLDAVVATYAAMSPDQRERVRGPVPDEDRTGAGGQRNTVMRESTIALLDDAITAERRAGRIVSMSQLVSEAARVATHAAEQRYRATFGTMLPPPPARLPNRPRR